MEVNAVMDLNFVTDSVFCVLQRSGHITLCDLRCSRLAKHHWLGHAGRASALKLCKDTLRFVTSARGSEAKLWDVRKASRGCVCRFNQHISENAPLGFDFLKFEQYLAIGSDDERACIYEMSTGRLVHNVKMGTGIVRTVCAVDEGSLSFYVSFMSGRYLGLVDCEGDDISHEASSQEDISKKFANEAWDAVTGKYTERILSVIRLVQHNVPFGYENWMHVIRQSELPACKQLLRDLSAEYEMQLQAAMPRIEVEIQRFMARQHPLIPTSQPKVQRPSTCGMAPPVVKERSTPNSPTQVRWRS